MGEGPALRLGAVGLSGSVGRLFNRAAAKTIVFFGNRDKRGQW
ncbi:hypothetical protein NY78_4116 [Desulfovibrio sp. TomC]|nr:hypothetical protein NY78_4116 [Desulfovibrio sp. TomC]